MAKIIWPGGAQVSGSTGATTYQRNGVQRRRSNPLNPQTPKQVAIRGNLSTYAAAWKNLSDFLRGGWNDRAALLPRVDRLGRTYFLTGFQEFLGVNTLSLKYGFPTTNIAPPVDTEWVTGTLTIAEANFDTTTPANNSVAFGGTFTLNGITDAYFLVEATPVLPPTINFVRPRFRAIGINGPIVAGANLADVQSLYETVFTNSWIGQAGSVIWFRVSVYHDGTRKVIGQLKAVITDITPP